jgi:GTP diphosphokinase / guanosine-3',5'-bis(diphosphate) 3'-diphosphatase
MNKTFHSQHLQLKELSVQLQYVYDRIVHFFTKSASEAMDIWKIQAFMSYISNFTDNPVEELEKVLDTLSYLSEQQKDEVREVYRYTYSFHAWVKRLSWEPYIIHPIRVLWFLATLSPDLPSIKAALMHDLIEDTEVTYEDIKERYGEEVATLCEWLVKVSKVRYRGEDRQIETLKKTFMAMASDLRVIIIKLADRIHNIQTLHFHPKKDKQIRIAEETLKIFVPIAKRLWLYEFQGYLENGAFSVLHPREYKKIVSHVIKQYGNAEMYKDAWIYRLEMLCKEEDIAYEKVIWRLKSPYRIRKKLGKYDFDLAKIMDILAFRILTHTVTDCYTILGIIHKHYTPIFSKMKDYIALPKPNWYKSLHTTVLWMFEFPIEIQVRTLEMDKVANYGVAAHYVYSDDSPDAVSNAQGEWITRLQDIVKKYSSINDQESFKNELDIEILQKNIFVYTPKWDVIELPQGSTVLDFAFRVHTSIGLKFKNAFINGNIVPIDYQIKTWDIVSIETFKGKYTVNSSWMRFLHTPSAKTKLLRHLRIAEKDTIMKQMIIKLNKRLLEFKLPLFGTKGDLISKRYQNEALEKLLYKLRDKQITITKFIKDTYPDAEFVTQAEKTKRAQQHKELTKSIVWVMSDQWILIDWNSINDLTLCPECLPKLWTKIIGKSWKDWIKIHTLSCSALKTIEYKKLLEAHWYWEEFNKYTLVITFKATHKPWMLLRIFKEIEFLWINIIDIQTWPEDTSWMKEVILKLAFMHPSKMWFFLHEMKKFRDDIKILSTSIE